MRRGNETKTRSEKVLNFAPERGCVRRLKSRISCIGVRRQLVIQIMRMSKLVEFARFVQGYAFAFRGNVVSYNFLDLVRVSKQFANMTPWDCT